MQQLKYTIKDKDGVHARPAGRIIQAASGFKSQISISAKGSTVSLKNGIFALLGLGIRCGEEIEVSCEGEDEESAIEKIKQALEENL
ncbi:MAG: HPr family phosphocarrier protein [Succinivibrio sp.]|nr:HPr family phosphocarrier protein [Succinivibrio sp.]